MNTKKAKFITACQTYIKREGINSLLEWMEKSDFFTAPASTRYHCSYEGGLCKHSLHVLDRLIREVKNEYGDPIKVKIEVLPDNTSKEVELDKSEYYWVINDTKVTLESITIIALFHDLSKTNFYICTTRNVKKDNVWVQEPFYQVNPNPAPENIYGTHAENSVYILNSYISTSHLENICIRHHMGGKDFSEESTNEKNTTTVFNLFPLALLTHIADMKATFIDEAIN